MSSIDERIVEMRFQNGQFERGVKESMSTLDKLKEALKLSGSDDGMDNLSKSTSKFSLGGIADAVDQIKDRFSILGAIGFTAIQRLTNGVINFGTKLYSNIVQPITQGGLTRAMNLEQARFQFQGLGMDVEASMASALDAVKGTAFGLDEAAVVAAQFGASGMQAGTEMTAALRGISGVAAMAGSSYSDIGRIFTKVAGQGRLMGDDLLSLGARGVNAAAVLGKAMGKTEAEIRDMVTKGQIDFQTFANAMSEAFGEHATRANETYSGSLSNLRAALARIGAAHYEKRLTALRDVFNATTPVIDGVADAIKPFIDLLNTNFRTGADSLIGVLNNIDLKPLEKSAPIVAKGIQAIVDTAKSITGAVFGAFKDIFPPATTAQVVAAAEAFRNFAESLKPSERTVENLRRTFRGLFAVVDIVLYVLGGLLGVVFDVVGQLAGLGGGVLELTGSFGDWLVTLRDAIKEGEGFNTFLQGLKKFLQYPIDGIKALAGYIRDLFDVIRNSDFVQNRLESWGSAGEFAASVWGGFVDVLKWIGDAIGPLMSAIGTFFKDLWSAITNSFASADFSAILDVINTGLIAGIFMLFKKALSGGIGNFVGDFFKTLFGGAKEAISDAPGLMDHIKDILGGVTDALSAMQTTLNAGTLILIAGAIATLTIAIVALSGIDSGKLTKSLVAIGIMMGELSIMLIILQKFVLGPTALKLPFIAGALILLSTALVILSEAVRKISKLNWEEIAKGLVGVAGMLAALGLFTTFAKYGKGQVLGGLGLILLSTALVILANALEPLGKMSWEELAKGLSTIAIALGIFAGAMALMPTTKLVFASGALVVLSTAIVILGQAIKPFSKMSWGEIAAGLTVLGGSLLLIAGTMQLMPSSKMLATSTGLLVVSGALLIIGEVMGNFAKFNWGEIAKSLVALAGSLAIIAGAMWIMPPHMGLQAVALVVLSGALVILGEAMTTLGGMTWGEIAKSLVTLAGSLAIIAGALYLMTAALPGAAALIVASGALAVLAPVMKSLGDMSWGDILKSLGMLAGTLTVLGIAAIPLGILSPLIALFAVSVGLLGGAVLLFGAGILAFGIGLGAIAEAGSAGVDTLVKAFDALLEAVPKIAKAFAAFLVALLIEITVATPKIVTAITIMILSLIQNVEKHLPQMQAAGLSLLYKLIAGLQQDLPGLIAVGVLFVVSLSQGLREHFPTLNDEAIALVTDFINSLADSIRGNTDELRDAAANLADAILYGLTGGLLGGEPDVIDTSKRVAGSVKYGEETGKTSGGILGDGVISGFIKSIFGGEKEVTGSAKEVADATKGAKGNGEISGGIVGGGLIAGLIGAIFDGKGSVTKSTSNTVDSAKGAKNTGTTAGTWVGGGIISGLMTSILGGRSGVSKNTGSVASSARDGRKQGESGGNNVGGGIISGIISGLTGGRSRIGSTAGSVARSARDGRETGRTAGSSVGGAIVSGMRSGMNSGSWSLRSTASAIARSALSAAKSALGIKSPSREFIKVGKFAIQGFSGGLSDFAYLSDRSAKDVGHSALDSLKDVLNELPYLVEDDMDLSPRITPVLDLSSFDRSLLSDNLSLTVDGSGIPGLSKRRVDWLNKQALPNVDQSKTSVAERVEAIQFTQINNSPKALSETEIYRQTKNQLSLLRGM